MTSAAATRAVRLAALAAALAARAAQGGVSAGAVPAVRAAAPAADRAAGGTAVPRKLFALYNRERIPGPFKDVAFLQLHRHAEAVLNFLGLEVDYHDASAGLPDPASLGGYRGIVAWFESPVNFADPAPVCRWLSAAMARGLPVYILGDPGLYRGSGAGPPSLGPACRAMYRALGLEVSGTRVVDPLSFKILGAAPVAAGFERRLDPEDVPSVPLVRLLPGATAYLRVGLGEGDPSETDPVAVTPRGAVAFQPFLLYINKELEPPQFRWILDPFAFFADALRLRGLPRPDVTTLSGRRVFFSQIDGDGFFNPSELDRRKYSGQVFLEEVLGRMPDSPFTASLITAYYDLPIYRDSASVALGKKVLNLPNVEPGSHGYAHPLVWRLGTVAVKVPGYVMNPEKEILGSTSFLNSKILSGGRRVAVFQWTGDALPSESALRLADRAGLLAINGEGGRFDDRYPSYSYLLPLARQVGRERQVYAPMSDEDAYTNLWQGPYYGYRDVLQTFERSGEPRRLKPVDVYVHYYSAERYAALESLRSVYAWARERPLTPVWASRYIRSVRAFFDMEIVRLGDRRWELRGGRDLRTIRFDDEKLVPDLAASRGVVGFRRDLGSLYVALDDSETRRIALAEASGPGPYLSEANFEVADWSRADGGARFRKRGWWTGECLLGGLEPGKAYRVRSGAFDRTAKADATGFLRVQFPDSERGGPAREVRVERAP